MFFKPEGTLVEAGQTMEVAAPEGKQLIDRGSADFIKARRISARD